MISDTASYANNSTTASYSLTASYSNNSLSSSYATTSNNTITASYATTSSYVQNAIVSSFGMVINGNGAVPSTGVKGFITIPYNLTVTSWNIFSNTTGSAVVDVIRSTYSNFGSGTSIAGSELPTLTNQAKNQNNTISTWTTTLNSGDIITFNLNSISNITMLSVSILGSKH